MEKQEMKNGNRHGNGKSFMRNARSFSRGLVLQRRTKNKCHA